MFLKKKGTVYSVTCAISRFFLQLFKIRSAYLFYKNRQGRMVDESEADTIKWGEGFYPHNLQTLINFSKYCEAQVPWVRLKWRNASSKKWMSWLNVSRDNSEKQHNVYTDTKKCLLYAISTSNPLKLQRQLSNRFLEPGRNLKIKRPI